MTDCPNCEYHKQRAQLWRDEAYKQAGHPLPERELVCVCGAVWEGQELVEAPPQRTWVGLTDEEKQEWIDAMPYDPEPRHCMILVNVIEVKLKEKNNG